MKKLLYILGICNVFLDINCMSSSLKRSAPEQGNPSQKKHLLCPYGFITTSPVTRVTRDDSLIKLPKIAIPSICTIRRAYLTAFVQHWSTSTQTFLKKVPGINDAAINTVDIQDVDIDEEFKTLLESGKQNSGNILTTATKRQQLFQVAFGIRAATELFSSYCQSLMPFIASLHEQKNFSLLDSLLDKIETLIKKFLKIPYKYDYKKQLGFFVNDWIFSLYADERLNCITELPVLFTACSEFFSNLSISIDILQTLRDRNVDQPVCSNQSIGMWLFTQLFPYEEFIEQKLYDLVLDKKSSMPELMQKLNVNARQSLFTVLSHQLESVLHYTEGKEENLTQFRNLFGTGTPQSKNMLMTYFNDIFNFAITDISSIQIQKETDPLVTTIICNCNWRKNENSGNIEIEFRDDEHNSDSETYGVYCPKDFVLQPSKSIPEKIVLSFLRYKISNCPYPMVCMSNSLAEASHVIYYPFYDHQPMSHASSSVAYIYIQLPLIEEMIQCKKMLDSGLIDKKILESDAGKEWARILDSTEMIDLEELVSIHRKIAAEKQEYMIKKDCRK